MGLDPVGWSEAKAAAQYLALDRAYDSLYASDLQRSLETASEIGSTLGLAVVTEPRLREIAAGQWEGKRFLDLDEQDRSAITDAGDAYRFPGGETWSEVQRRASQAIREIAARHKGGRVVVVTHGGTIRAILSNWGRGDLRDQPVPNGSITRMLWCDDMARAMIRTIGEIPSVNRDGL